MENPIKNLKTGKLKKLRVNQYDWLILNFLPHRFANNL